MKAIELVRKVAKMRSSLRAERGERGAMASAGRVFALRLVQATTVAAHRMQSLPIPAPRATERVVLASAASQLRAMADLADRAGPSGDPEIESALAALVAETLALVDKVLATSPELPSRDPRALPGGDDAADGESARETSKKVSF